MKQIYTLVAVSIFTASPVFSQESGTTLMERGARLFLEGIMREVEPAMKDLKGLGDTLQPALRDFVREMGPALGEILEKIEDFSSYHPPVMLPNGDIIMRKKTPKEMENPDGETET
ncbi:MAG: hypothetical protein Q9M48_01835 [Rhodobacterales bacterium]|nr:hypothetical protein [Rhodobacterales bacterium]